MSATSPTIVAKFLGGIKIRMTVCTSPTQPDLKRALRLAGAGFESRTRNMKKRPKPKDALLSAGIEADGALRELTPEEIEGAIG